MAGKRAAPRRVSWRLLSLLWVWALLMFVVLDLFLNIEHFDFVRPSARIYRATRWAGHAMVGEPYLESDEFAACAPETRPATPRHAVLTALPTYASYLSVTNGIPTDYFTSYRLAWRMHVAAARTDDPARRQALERAVARLRAVKEWDATRTEK